MAKGTVHLCVGIYERLETAEEDYADLNKLHHAGLVGAYDAAVVERVRPTARSTIADRKKDTTHGAWTGVGVGALAGLLFPPALIGTAVVGGVAGGLVGKARERLVEGRGRGARRGPGRARDRAGRGGRRRPPRARRTRCWPGPSRRIVRELDLTKDDIGQVMQERASSRLMGAPRHSGLSGSRARARCCR